MGNVLVVSTDYDPATAYLAAWTEPVAVLADKKGIRIIRLQREKAVRSEFASVMKKTQPSFVWLNGHGGPDSFFGHKDAPMLDGANSGALKKSVTFARACECLAVLGAGAVKGGCLAFVGYRLPFIVACDLHKYASRPLEDELAKPAMEASNAVAVTLLKGGTVEEAVDSSHRVAYKELKRLLFSKDPASKGVLYTVLANDDCLGVVGDVKATI